MITAVQIAFTILSFVDEVMGNQLADHALGFMIFIVGRHHFQRFAVRQLRKQTLLENVRVIGDQNVTAFRIRCVER